MREKDEINGLFRSRLADTEMTVRDGFWEKLQEGLSQAEATEQKAVPLFPKFYRVAAAASVILVLGAASAAFWYFSPKEEIKEAFTQVAVLTPDGSLNGDVVQETFPSIHEANPTIHKPGTKQPGGGAQARLMMPMDEDDESVSVRVSITISQRTYGNRQNNGNGFYNNYPTTRAGNGYQDTGKEADADTYSNDSADEATPLKHTKLRKWALKAGIGTSLPKGDCNMPLTAGLTVERSLNKWLALETGVQYNRLRANGTLHTLSIPLKMNLTMLSTSKVDLYASVGGAAEKCIAGAVDNGFGAEPVQLSVAAGVGVRYKLNDRFALFAEPSVSHHFDTNSQSRTLRTERPTNLNLLCGVRMTY